MAKDKQLNYFLIGIILCGLSVLFGAFGAHALRTKVDANYLEVFKTGVQYQMYHGFGILILETLNRQFNLDLKKSLALMFAGTLVFSSSLYLLVLTNIRMFGAITPFGGLMLLVSWALAAKKVAASFSRH